MNSKHKNYIDVYNDLISRLRKKKSEQIFNVENAFFVAEKQHIEQFRHSGEPYISHPVAVANILEKLDFDTDVISGALLHDVVEDTNYTLDEIKVNFNREIAQIVDGVTAITQENYQPTIDAIFENQDFLKPSLESQTYHKLLKIGKKNRFAFYIKFADRLHNLQTIDSMKDYKRLEKVKETEKWILPLCSLLKSSYFYYQIKNECFKIVNEKKITNFLQEYNRLISFSQKPNEILKEQLFSYITSLLSRHKNNIELHKIAITPQVEEIIYEEIVDRLQIKGLQNIKASHLYKVPTHNIFIVVKNDISLQKSNELLFDILDDPKINAIFTIDGIKQDKLFDSEHLTVTHQKHNKFNITLLSYANYLKFLNGSTEGTELDLIDEENSNEIETDFIKVKTRSNEIIKIPQGSTLLDFAFKIHNDIGFSFKYGLINNSPAKHPHFTKLKDGDKINIVTEIDENTNQNVYVAQIRWLAYVKTETAKKALIRHFEKELTNALNKNN